MIQSKHFKLLGVLFIAGALLNLFNSVFIRILVMNTSGWGDRESTILNSFDVCTSLILLACIVFFFIRKMNKLDVARSSGIVFIYALFALAIEQITISTIGYNTFLIWLFYPSDVFNFILQGLLKLSGLPVLANFLITNLFVFTLAIFGKSSQQKFN